MKTDVLDYSAIKAVIFDMDGTMVDNNEFHMRAFQEFCRRHGKILSDEEFMDKFVGRQNNHLMPMVFGEDLSQEEVEAYGDEKEAIYREMYADHIRPVFGLHDFLKLLKEKDIKVAIATGANEANRKFVLQKLDLIHTFDEIVGSEEIKHGKPEPDIFLATAEKLGISPEKCIVFEDAPAGITAAKRAGMEAVALTTTHTEDELKEADVVVKDFAELL